jgi:hypothetical protein
VVVPELWGVDDAKEVRRIQRLANKEFRFTRAFWKGSLICGGVTGLLVLVFDLVDLKPEWLRGGMAGAIGGVATSFVLDRHRRAALRPILKGEHRCTKCGYDLKNNANETCPECGQMMTNSE